MKAKEWVVECVVAGSGTVWLGCISGGGAWVSTIGEAVTFSKESDARCMLETLENVGFVKRDMIAYVAERAYNAKEYVQLSFSFM